ncbi:radical SAM family heme chaperone HemW [Bacteroidales bacterium OttesenSCG-928-B11]|nr:radical SAM family heme chaperone HemW [Bacteroidales bacterium OttesenSCG-928-C03]MDL2312639.1 radical SAM family heme chaperone HemW [Bacteroidales bacterium OttesenSCG-928-B11]MDL2326109.1 radical SAM family heme chaperone HemW [Bacteroidales bacterium OttesenSCG-928-A14]
MAGLYIHFPFCKSKCIYCSFYSIATLSLKDDYIQALCNELRLRKSFLNNQSFDTIYFGGGTPSLFTPQELEIIINAILKELNINSEIEFTMELNPDGISLDDLSGYKSLGINRLSIGVQSFNNHILKLLRRRHNVDDIDDVIRNAVKVGFENISIDLIYGILERTTKEWKEEIIQAFSYPITHLSAYSLTVEENTLLSKQIRCGDRAVPSEEKAINDYLILQTMLKSNDFQQYEISNYTKNNKISRHNNAYWQNIPYLGLGPSAHSYDLYARYWNTSDINLYINSVNSGKIPCEKEELSSDDQYNEFILLRLRTTAGIDLIEMQTRFGETMYNYFLKNLHKITNNHYIMDEKSVILTDQGRLFADYIAGELFSCKK